MVTAAMELKDNCSLEGSYGKLRQLLKSKDISLPIEVHIVKAVVFPEVMYSCELGHKES